MSFSTKEIVRGSHLLRAIYSIYRSDKSLNVMCISLHRLHKKNFIISSGHDLQHLYIFTSVIWDFSPILKNVVMSCSSKSCIKLSRKLQVFLEDETIAVTQQHTRYRQNPSAYGNPSKTKCWNMSSTTNDTINIQNFIPFLIQLPRIFGITAIFIVAIVRILQVADHQEKKPPKLLII